MTIERLLFDVTSQNKNAFEEKQPKKPDFTQYFCILDSTFSNNCLIWTSDGYGHGASWVGQKSPDVLNFADLKTKSPYRTLPIILRSS